MTACIEDRRSALEALINAKARNLPPAAQRGALEAAAALYCGRQWDWVMEERMDGSCAVVLTAYLGDDAR